MHDDRPDFYGVTSVDKPFLESIAAFTLSECLREKAACHIAKTVVSRSSDRGAKRIISLRSQRKG
jgi:hypothetical protein